MVNALLFPCTTCLRADSELFQSCEDSTTLGRSFQLVNALPVLIGIFVPGQEFIVGRPRIRVVVSGSVAEGQLQLLGQKATTFAS